MSKYNFNDIASQNARLTDDQVIDLIRLENQGVLKKTIVEDIIANSSSHDLIRSYSETTTNAEIQRCVDLTDAQIENDNNLDEYLSLQSLFDPIGNSDSHRSYVYHARKS